LRLGPSYHSARMARHNCKGYFGARFTSGPQKVRDELGNNRLIRTRDYSIAHWSWGEQGAGNAGLLEFIVQGLGKRIDSGLGKDIGGVVRDRHIASSRTYIADRTGLAR